jgi:hypothetical protein
MAQVRFLPNATVFFCLFSFLCAVPRVLAPVEVRVKKEKKEKREEKKVQKKYKLGGSNPCLSREWRLKPPP